MSMFVLFFRPFWLFLKFDFFTKNGATKLTPKQPDRIFLVNFSKVQQLSNKFSKLRGYID